MIVCQNGVYPRKIKNAYRYTIGGGMVSALHYIRVSQWGWVLQDKCLRQLSLKFIFLGQYRATPVCHIAPQPMCQRLNHTPATWYGVRKRYGMDARGFDASIKLRWMDVWDALILWITCGLALDCMTEWVVKVDDTPWLWIVLRYMSHVNLEPRWHWEATFNWETE